MTLLGSKTILHKKCRSGKNSEGPMSSKMKSNFKKSALMLHAWRRSKNINFYSLWFDILYRIEKWYSVPSGQSPRFAVLSGQIDVRKMSMNHWLWGISLNVLKWILKLYEEFGKRKGQFVFEMAFTAVKYK